MAQLEFLNSLPNLPPVKSVGAYKTISEVSDELDVPQHVLRFWESHFAQVKPTRMRGRRYYRPEDIDFLKAIKSLLYVQGYTIKGAKQLVKNKDFIMDEHPAPAAVVVKPEPVAAGKKKQAEPDIQSLVSELRVLKTMLTTLL